MKTKLIAAIMGLAAFASSASVTISDVIVRQQWPWNGKVNIDYVLTDPEDGEHDITVVMSNGTQVVTNEYGSLSGDLFGVKPGARRIVWNPMHNNPTYAEKVLASFSVTLSTPDDSSRQYMILDLSGDYAANAEIPVSFASAPPVGGWNVDTYKTTKMVLRRIPAGTFMMGSPANELGRAARGEELHPVTLTKDFYVALFECTQKQFAQIYGSIPTQTYNLTDDKWAVAWVSYEHLRGPNSLKTSANGGTWPRYNSPGFFATLNARAARPVGLDGYDFDLMSSSQWEYACRAGTPGAFYNGATITNQTTDANASLIGKYTGVSIARGPGGQFLPNGFGLYDMVGNFSELVQDEMTGSGAFWREGVHLTDPLLLAPDNYSILISRGGNSTSNAAGIRSAKWDTVAAVYGSSTGWLASSQHMGFRVALVYRGE